MGLPWPTWLLGAWIFMAGALGSAAMVDAAADAPIPPSRPSTESGAGPPASASMLPAGQAYAAPVRVEAPTIELAATVVPVTTQSDGALEVPAFGLAGWYQGSTRPGEQGAAVLVGHVDSYDGPDIFFRLRDLQPGDPVTVHDADGRTITFVVEHTETVDKDALPVARVFGDPGQPALRLVTCGGEFDRSSRSYRSNLIVYARPAPVQI